MRLDFDSNEDSVSQAYILHEALAQWLVEQPLAQPLRPGHAEFIYRADGTLDSIRTVLDDIT